MKAGKFRLPTHSKLLMMNVDEWVDAKHEVVMKYFMELYKETPKETRKKEFLCGHVSKREDGSKEGVFRKMGICLEIFERSLRRHVPNKRRRVTLELEELTPREKYFLENLLIKFVMQGRLSGRWIRDIDFGQCYPEEKERKKEMNSGLLMIMDEESKERE